MRIFFLSLKFVRNLFEDMRANNMDLVAAFNGGYYGLVLLGSFGFKRYSRKAIFFIGRDSRVK